MAKLNPLDKYADVNRNTEWVELSWWMTSGDNKKRVSLHNKLYGYIARRKDKRYYYDGILMGWKEVDGRMKRVKLHDYIILGQAHIVIPKTLQLSTDTIFSKIEIDHRWHPYMPKNNLVVIYA